MKGKKGVKSAVFGLCLSVRSGNFGVDAQSLYAGESEVRDPGGTIRCSSAPMPRLSFGSNRNRELAKLVGFRSLTREVCQLTRYNSHHDQDKRR